MNPEEARQADGRLVLIAGEAGVGKSALVEQLERGLPEATWYWGACDGLFTPRPLGPLFDIAGQLGGELLELCRADAPREELFSALQRQVSAPGELQLFISVKTVDHHVSAVLAKLDAPTRRAAATRAAKLGLVKTAPLAAEPPDHARLRPGQGRLAGVAGRQLGDRIDLRVSWAG